MVCVSATQSRNEAGGPSFDEAQHPWHWNCGTISTKLDAIWGMSGHCPERASLATDPVVLFRLLSRIPYTPVARQGHAGPPISSADRFREDCGISTSRRSASPIRAPRGLIGGGFRFCVESGDRGAEPLTTSSSGALFLANPSLGRTKNGWRTVLGNFYGSIASKITPTTASRFASVTGMR